MTGKLGNRMAERSSAQKATDLLREGDTEGAIRMAGRALREDMTAPPAATIESDLHKLALIQRDIRELSKGRQTR